MWLRPAVVINGWGHMTLQDHVRGPETLITTGSTGVLMMPHDELSSAGLSRAAWPTPASRQKGRLTFPHDRSGADGLDRSPVVLQPRQPIPSRQQDT